MILFGDRLKEARTARRMTQKQLAALCETDEAVIRAYEKNRRVPGYDKLLLIFNALETPPDYFFQDQLSYNPYKDKGELYTDIVKLLPVQYEAVRSYVDQLIKQN
jgi:transcriptional regulator with XRE-family HTH domain